MAQPHGLQAMDDTLALQLRQLVTSRTTASLGTLHAGAPYVSMVPFALSADGSAFVVHVSRLAAHTHDMLADPRVSLLITESEQSGIPPQALPRATVQGTARQLSVEAAEYEPLKKAYLTRFPDSAMLFDLGDFSLFAITPSTVRWVAGFGQALSLSPESFARALTGRG